jgi:hypothetical protein
MTKERVRVVVLAFVLVALALLSSTVWVTPAVARPCCTECPSYPVLNPQIDSCAKWCDFGC